MKIQKISIYKDKYFTDQIYLRESDGKPIILFHLKNQSGKTTLYNIIRHLLSGEKIDNKKVDNNVVGSASVDIQYNENIITLKGNEEGFYRLINNEEQSYGFQEYMLSEVFGKNKDEKINYGGDKTSLSSLLRFSFFSDEDFNGKDSKSADLIHQKFDGQGKKILFLYCLGATLSDDHNRNSTFTETNMLTKKINESKSLEDDLKSEIAQNITQGKQSLFNDHLDANLYKSLQNNKLLIENLTEISKKLEILIIKSRDLNLDEGFIGYLDAEQGFIKEGLEKINQENGEINKKINVFSINPKDLLTYEQKEKKLLDINNKIDEIEKKLLSSIEDKDIVIQNYQDIIQILQNSTYKFSFDHEQLKVELSQSSEGILKGSKFLANLALQIYAIKYGKGKSVALLPVGFYDSVFGGSDIDIIIECLNKILLLEEEIRNDIQIFIFTNRYNGYDYKSEIDQLVEKNSSFIQEEKTLTNQKYLFTTSSYHHPTNNLNTQKIV